MSDPTRLEESGGESEKGLLRAWRSRQPTEAARLGTLTAVGASAAAGLAGGGAAVLPKAGILSSSVVKWLAVTAGVAAATGATTYAVERRRATPPVPVTAAERERSPEASLVPVAPPTPAAPPLPAVEVPAAKPQRITTPVAPAATAPAATAAPTKPAAPLATLDDEVRAIDHARRALQGGDASGALDLLDGYDTRFPAGALAEESSELRIEALYKVGRRSQADALVARFLSLHPASPYVRVVRALAGGATGPAP